MSLRKIYLRLIWCCLFLWPALALGQPFQIRVQTGDTISTVGNNGVVNVNGRVGQVQIVTFTLIYRGTATASLSGTSITGASQFSLTANPDGALQPGQSAQMTVRFLPTSGAKVVADIAINVSESLVTGPPQVSTLFISLVGAAPQFFFYVNDVSGQGNFAPFSSGDHIVFPQTTVNSPSSLLFVAINRGSGSGTVQQIQLTGSDFQLQGLPILPATVEAGQDIRFTIRYLPRQAGQGSGQLRVVADAGEASAILDGTAQVTLFTYELLNPDGSVQGAFAPDATVDLPSPSPGETGLARFRIRNASPVDSTVTSVSVTGTGFQIAEAPPLPFVLPPAASFTFSVSYTSGLTGKLRVNNDTLNFSIVAPALNYSFNANGANLSVAPGGTILLPSAAVGVPVRTDVTITNRGSGAAVLPVLSAISPDGSLRIAAPLTRPVTIGPGASVQVTVEWTPVSSGSVVGTLLLGNVQFSVAGTASSPPSLPVYQFDGASGAQPARSQISVGLSLVSPYALPLSGVLTLGFSSDTAGIDAALQFSTGGRAVTFTIPAGATRAVFANGSTSIRLQTGTVAGTILLTPTFSAGGNDVSPSSPVVLSLQVSPDVPKILDVQSLSSGDNLTITITGYSNTRALDVLDFQFTAAPGIGFSSASFRANVATTSSIYFGNVESYNFGGLFTVSVPFTILARDTDKTIAPAKLIQSVSVSATNDRGKSATFTIDTP
jgi:hypothetical protein